MQGIDKANLDAATHAEAEVSILLLLSLTEALLARKALMREDIAGALLRTEHRAKVLDDIRKEEGAIISPLEGRAQLATDAWQANFGLEPELYTIRKKQGEYQKAGKPGLNPWFADQVIALYADAHPEEP